MKIKRVALLLLLSAAAIHASPGPVRAQDRAKMIIERNDKDGDGRISGDEWPRGPAMFDRMDADGDGFLTLEELRAFFANQDGMGGKAAKGPMGQKELMAPSQPAGDAVAGRATLAALDAATLCGIGRGFTCDAKISIERGLFETGLRPRFPAGARCRDIDEGYAIPYAHKRDRELYHGGIDLPAPFGTPIVAAASGTVVGVFPGEKSPRGIEVVLRHSPEETGIPLWIYTEYTHFEEMPKLKVGQRVRMGEYLGPTGNTGAAGKASMAAKKAGSGKQRRPAIHFGVFYSTSDKFVEDHGKIIPVDGWWMDPVALFRKKLPLDSAAMKALPDGEKQVPISVILEDGKTEPADTKLIWPYKCGRG